jgi:hypothetical protein
MGRQDPIHACCIYIAPNTETDSPLWRGVGGWEPSVVPGKGAVVTSFLLDFLLLSAVLRLIALINELFPAFWAPTCNIEYSICKLAGSNDATVILISSYIFSHRSVSSAIYHWDKLGRSNQPVRDNQGRSSTQGGFQSLLPRTKAGFSLEEVR